MLLSAVLVFSGCNLFAPEDKNPTENNQGEDKKELNPEAFPLADYSYKLTCIGSEKANGYAEWGSGSTITENADGSLTLGAANLWGGDSGVCLALTNMKPGIISFYDYIVFTVDTTEYTISEGEGNNGVNVKVPEVQKKVTDTYNVYKDSDDVVTYYIETSAFGEAPKVAKEMALIIGGTGSLKVTEVYLAAKENPVKAVNAITIDPATTSAPSGDKVTFTVKDSNLNDVTATVVYTIEGEDATNSSIEANVLTAGSTSGTVTVKATYTCDDGTFETTSTITVLATMKNLVTKVDFKKAFLAPGWAPILDNVENYDDAKSNVLIDNGTVSYTLPTGLVGDWQAQLFLTTDASLAEGDEWYVSFKLSGIDGKYTFKLNDAEVLMPQSVASFTDGDVITFSGKVDAPEKACENIVLTFDFGTCPAGTVTISDIVIAKTN